MLGFKELSLALFQPEGFPVFPIYLPFHAFSLKPDGKSRQVGTRLVFKQSARYSDSARGVLGTRWRI